LPHGGIVSVPGNQRRKEVKGHSFALAGLVSGGIGLLLGMTMSSSIPSTPSAYGLAAAVYAAIAAASFAGRQRRQRDIA
jgi:small basic protein